MKKKKKKKINQKLNETTKNGLSKSQSEYELQKSVVKYLQLQYPLAKFCASLGGIRTSYTQAVKAKASGYIKGFPDLQICYPTRKSCGLFLEIKKDRKSYASKSQHEWIEYLNEVGYTAKVCKGFDECKEVIDDYMDKQYDGGRL
tara:strand:+ start:1156 stop:1590 length:435 start_codon:yes stop_codon:yes gene_type:complete